MADVEYVVCPFCGRTKWRATSFQWTYVEPMKWKYLQVRRGGGKRKPLPGEKPRKGRGRGYGVGFKVVPELSKTIPEMFEDERYRDIAENIKARLLLIVGAWVREGFITLDEIEAISR
jgi:hypothetical protein